MIKIQAHRYHDFSAGHRVVGHENKCKHLHGHNYRIHFYCEAPQLDNLGRVIDFGIIKQILCQWLEDVWDHKMLIWEQDPLLEALKAIDKKAIVTTDFNPTAENMAQYLLEVKGPNLLKGTDVTLTKVVIEETRKCSVTAEIIPSCMPTNSVARHV